MHTNTKVLICLLILACCLLAGYYILCPGAGERTTSVQEAAPRPASDSSWFDDDCRDEEDSPQVKTDQLPPPVPCKSSPDPEEFPENTASEMERQMQAIKSGYRGGGCAYSESIPLGNSLGLVNIGSVYLGATTRVPDDTLPFLPKESRCGGSGCHNDAVSIIQPELVFLGKNWKFQGSNGSIMIGFGRPALITGITLVHPKKQDIPFGFLYAAPKIFKLYGVKSNTSDSSVSVVELGGNLLYDDNGTADQTFPVDNKCMGEPYNGILVKILDNHGHSEYTAIYKIEIHGVFAKPVKDKPKESSSSSTGSDEH